MHDHRGFAPRLRALRDEKPGLLFDCGDSLRGSQTMYYRNEPIIAEIDEAGYDAQAIGNREFSYAYPLLRARSQKMQHPLVCTNLLDTKGRELPFLPSMVMRTDDTTVHILGLLIMQYPVGSFYERIFGWRFLDPWDAVAPYAERMPEGDMLLVLSHVGTFARSRACQARAAHRFDSRRPQPRHALRAGVCQRRADRARRTVRAICFAHRADVLRAAQTLRDRRLCRSCRYSAHLEDSFCHQRSR